MSKKIIIVINSDWFFLLHRVPIANSFKSSGFEVIVAAKDTGKREKIEKLGFVFENIDFDRKSTNLLIELKTIIQLYNLFKKRQPRVVYQVTIKPIIYGLLINRFFKIKSINTICGLGYVFTNEKKNHLRRLIVFLYKFVFRNSNSFTFFENKNDLNTFLNLGIITKEKKNKIVNGAGVNLDKFNAIVTRKVTGKINVVFPSRMLWDKGVEEFIEAAKLLEKKYKGVVFFKLYGMIDEGNKEAVSKGYLEEIKIADYLEWFGFKEDMVSVYEGADIVVLPSYYGEGLPTSLAEACAMGLPIITTDSVGCKECVDEGVNGFKVPIKSVYELANAIENLILNEDLRIDMGNASRLKAEKDFDQKKIVKQYSEVFEKMINE